MVDGLAAEREQGITIDVAYRFFATEHRKFIVADTPGHEQYTRNMATGASTADLAVLLIDARQGVLTQTKRHAFIASQLGVRHIVLAVNKMDLVDYSENVFNEIVEDFKAFAAQLDIPNLHAIPVSALVGDNVVDGSRFMPWYEGPSLLGYLEGVDVEAEETSLPFRMPVQWVNRPDLILGVMPGALLAALFALGMISAFYHLANRVKSPVSSPWIAIWMKPYPDSL